MIVIASIYSNESQLYVAIREEFQSKRLIETWKLLQSFLVGTALKSLSTSLKFISYFGSIKMEETQQEFEDACSLVQKLPKDGLYKVLNLLTIWHTV